MYPMSAQELASHCGGELIIDGGDSALATVCTDTRALEAGDVFVALRGDRFDAHNFLCEALQKQPGAIIVEEFSTDLPVGSATVIKVADTLVALQKLATWQREQITNEVVVITGSNGKTSTKDFTKAVLAQAFSVNATLGNLNNHIGLPLTILKTQPEHTGFIFEIGMNHPGELQPLCEISQPTIGIITNVGTAHIEHMGSQAAIAKEKGTLARNLPADGTLIIPHNCAFLDEIKASTQAKVILVGGDESVRAEEIELAVDSATFTLVIGDEKASVKLPVTGEHMVTNALLAAAAGTVLKLGVSQIARGLSHTQLTSGRLRQFQSGSITVLDDTYNANPDSVIAALHTLKRVASGRAIAVLGAMAELGEHANESYNKVAQVICELDLDTISVGEETRVLQDKAPSVQVAKDADDAVDRIKGLLTAGDTILFKGSRSAAVEKIMERSCPAN